MTLQEASVGHALSIATGLNDLHEFVLIPLETTLVPSAGIHLVDSNNETRGDSMRYVRGGGCVGGIQDREYTRYLGMQGLP